MKKQSCQISNDSLPNKSMNTICWKWVNFGCVIIFGCTYRLWPHITGGVTATSSAQLIQVLPPENCCKNKLQTDTASETTEGQFDGSEYSTEKINSDSVEDYEF